MKIFKLTPIKENFSHPDWKYSDTQKVILDIRADSEINARNLAFGKYGKPAVVRSLNQATQHSPWMKPELVKCIEIGNDNSTVEEIINIENMS